MRLRLGAWAAKPGLIRFPVLILGFWAVGWCSLEPAMTAQKPVPLSRIGDTSWWNYTHRSRRKEPNRLLPLVRHRHLQVIDRLAGPYARLVVRAAKANHVSARLIAAVIQVENGGDFEGSASRVSSAGAIGVMQLEPITATAVLHVNAWNPRQNIQGGARFLAMLLHQFGGNVRLALMAYNAGPTWIAQGGRPQQAVMYARKVMRDAYA